MKFLVVITGLLICVHIVETVSTMSHGPADFILRVVNQCPLRFGRARAPTSPAVSPVSSVTSDLKISRSIPLFDMGFLQLVQGELHFKDDSGDRKYSSVRTHPYLNDKGVKAVIDYRRNKVLRGINSVAQSFRDLTQKIYETRHYLLAGALGRCVAVSVMFPVDTIKTRLQMYGSSCCSPSQWSQALRMPIYNGVSSSLLGQVPIALCALCAATAGGTDSHRR
jgi:hypothetical protein